MYDKRPQPPREVLNENCENFGRISEKLNSIRKIMLEQSSLEPESSYHVTSNLNWFRYVSRVENIAKALPKEAKILEVGCGLGQVAAMLKVLRPDLKVVGSDVEYSEAWERLKSYGCDFIKSDAKNLPFGDGEFDAVVSFGVMEHVKNDDEFLGEISRVLRNCGDNFIFDLPNKYAFSEKVVGKVLSTITGKKIQHHEVRYTKKKVKKLLDKHGFKLIDIKHEFLIPAQVNRFNAYLGELADKHYLFLNKVDEILTRTPFAGLSQTLSIYCKKFAKKRL